MIHYVFADRLREHPFARGNDYDYSLQEPSALLFGEESKEVPLIYKEPRGFHKNGQLMYTEAVQLRARALTREKVTEIVNTAHLLLKIRYAGEWWLMGKGFIALFDENAKKMQPLFVVTIPNHTGWTDADVTFYLSKLLRTKAYKALQPVVESLTEGHQGDLVYTSDLHKFVGDRMVLPPFKTLAERRKYVDNLISHGLELEKRKFVDL